MREEIVDNERISRTGRASDSTETVRIEKEVKSNHPKREGGDRASNRYRGGEKDN